MIELEVLESPDNEVLGRHQYFYPSLTLGRSSKAHLFVHDPTWPPLAFVFETSSHGPLVHNAQLEFYHVNGKRFSGKKKLFCGDQIRGGDTLFSLVLHTPATFLRPLNIDEKTWPSPESPQRQELLEALEQELHMIDGEG